MPVNLNTLPGPALRPLPPKPLRWLSALVGLVAAGILLMRFLGKLVGETTFWWFAIGIPVIVWTVLMGFRLAVYMMQQIHANAWDQRREQVILQEVRRGRRALQILGVECRTAHEADAQFTTVVEALLLNETKIFPQTSWRGEGSVRHSRLPVTEGLLPHEQVSATFTDLLESLTEPLSRLDKDNPVAILLESSSSLSTARIQELWQETWLESGLPQPMRFITGGGMMAIDHWLDHRIKDNAVLLVIALQIAPEHPEMTAETAVGLLLGNRLTQNTLVPIALLHRPESSAPQPEILQEKLLQAADWVPLLPDSLQHLWLTGVYRQNEAYQSAVVAQNKAPLVSIDLESGVHNFDEFLGDPGRAGPWLAIAAAAQAIGQSPVPHMIISGEQGSETVWCTVVAPIASHKENTA
jgi:hypothetical protein